MTPEQKAAHERLISVLPKKTHIRMADPTYVTQEMVEHWKALHRVGHSYREIGVLCGRSKQTVMDYCNGRK